jgi:hypothetical protein
MPPSASASSVVASARMPRAWAGWVAITTASKMSTPLAVVISTLPGCRRTAETGVASRMSGRVAASFSTYRSEPPVTVRHCGDPLTPSMPWCARNVKRYRAG